MYGDLCDKMIEAAVRRAEELHPHYDGRRVAAMAVRYLESEIGRRLTGGEIQLVAEGAGQVWR